MLIAEPSEQTQAHQFELLSLQCAELAHCPNDGVGSDILYQESPWLQKGDGHLVKRLCAARL